MSIVFYYDEEQLKEVDEVKKQLEIERNHKIFTEIIPFKNFYLAEGYHQKYYLQQVSKVYKELKGMYNSFSDFVSSTLVARINGYVAGKSNLSILKEEFKELDISEEKHDKLLNMLEDLGLEKIETIHLL